MKLESLWLWDDATPRDGALNMALDEAMLHHAREPWLRVYRWDRPTISIGFSQPPSVIPASQQGWPFVRRWTGGGVVAHEGDWTYTLAVPGGHAVGDQQAVETYRWIHEAIVGALNECGFDDCSLQAENTSDGMGVCFDEPARFDIVRAGRKIAGAAQRRSRLGFLHQGSLQPLQPPGEFAGILAHHLAAQVAIAGAPQIESIVATGRQLALDKYGSPGWLYDRISKPAG